MRHVQISKTQEAFFLDVMEHMQLLTQKHSSVTNMECIAVLSRAVGMCVSGCAPDEMATMRQLAIDNIDSAAGGSRGGRTVN